MRCAQSATVPCRLSCGQCSDARFVLDTCILDMYLIHVFNTCKLFNTCRHVFDTCRFAHFSLERIACQRSQCTRMLFRGEMYQVCIVLSCMCVSCVSQSSFIQRCRHVYSYKHIRRLPWIPPCGAAWSAARSYHDLLLHLNTLLRSGLVSRSLVARPSFTFEYPLAERPGQPLARSTTFLWRCWIWAIAGGHTRAGRVVLQAGRRAEVE